MKTEYVTESVIHVQEVQFKQIIISATKPNNIVQLKNGLYFKIKKICLKNNEAISINNIQIYGCAIKKRKTVLRIQYHHLSWE